MESVKTLIVKDPHGKVIKQDTFAVVGQVDVSVDGAYGEPSATPTYLNGMLDIAFHNLKGNGIVSAVQTKTSTEDGGENEWTVTMNSGESFTITVYNGTKGDKGNDGNTVILNTEPGDPSEPDTYKLYSDTGANNDGAMTQKGVTETIDDVRKVTDLVTTHYDTDFNYLDMGASIVSSTNGEMSHSSSGDRYANEIAVDANTYEVKYPCRSFTGNIGYAFVKADGITFVSGAKDTENGYRTITREEILAAVGAGAAKLRITIRDNSTYKYGYDVKTFQAGARLTEIEDSIEDLEEDTAAIEVAVDGIESELRYAETEEVDVNTTSVPEGVTVDVDGNPISGVNYNVLSTNGKLKSTQRENAYANEISIDESTYEVKYRSLTFNDPLGYAFLTDSDVRVAGKHIASASDLVDGGKFALIERDEIMAAIALGATKLRFSVIVPPAGPDYFTVKTITSDSRLDNLDERVDDLDERVDALEEKKMEFYHFLGSPSNYVADVDSSQVLDDNTRVKENPSDTVGIGCFTSTEELYAAFDALVEAHPDWFSKETDLGVADHAEGDTRDYSIRHYCLRYQYPTISADPSREWPSTKPNLWSDATYKPRRVIVNLGVHPTEKWSLLGGYLAIKEILESHEPWAMFIKANFILDIVPCLNPWGLNNNSVYKYSADGEEINLNRTYIRDVQPENTCMINLIQAWKNKGLMGAIDLHNCSDRGGYFVANPGYQYFDYYAVLTQQIGGIMRDAMVAVNSNTNFRLWEAARDGQLHDYADTQGILGCTFEILSLYKAKGALLSKSILVNLINAFGTYY